MDGTSGPSRISRRRFVSASLTATGGLAIAVGFPGLAHAVPLAPQAWGPEAREPEELNAFVSIEPDGSVRLRVPHAELGQGTVTALAMLLAEELECDWAAVKAEHAAANRNLRQSGIYGSMHTTGSQGIRGAYRIVQQAGASARVRLIAAAAKRWSVAPGECTAEQGQVVHTSSGRKLGFGALAAEAAQITLDHEPEIRAPEQFKLAGRPLARLDTPVKINGTAQFGIDTRIPGMVYAAVASCPVFGGTLKSVDEAPIRGRRGVLQVVRLDDAVAVVADRFWRAKEALALLQPVWDTGPNGTTDSAQFRKLYRDTLDGPMVTARQNGDVDAQWTPDGQVVEALYEAPHLAHAPMEPLNATVHLQADRLDIWLSSQAPMNALAIGAAMSGLKPEQVYVHNCFVGGGFGRRSEHDELHHAMAVAKAVQKPVKLVWTREQDMQHDRYRPQAAVRFKSALAPNGLPAALDVRVAVGSIQRSLGGKVENGLEAQATDGIANIAYRIPNLRVGVMLRNTHVPVMYWRSVGGSQNCFFMESFIDEMAHAAGQDPYKFRRALLDRKDYLGVLDMIAEKSGWGTPLPAGSGRGIAVTENHGAVIGQVAEVTVSRKGEVRVDRVVAAVDCYHAVNPRIIEQQIEGGIIYGLSAVLYGEITIKNGAVEQSNFDSYPMVRLAETPKIETYLSLSGGPRWGGIGEPGVAPLAPAIANAIFAATGKRVRSLPLKNVDLSGPV